MSGRGRICQNTRSRIRPWVSWLKRSSEPGSRGCALNMKTLPKRHHSEPQWIKVDQLRAGDTVELAPDQARVIMVEKADATHVLVAYEGREPIDYPIAAKLWINARASA